MKRAARDALATCVGQRCGARQHARCSAARKSQQQDRLGLRADFHQTRHAIDERACFSGACAGDDQQRTFGGRYCFELRFVEFFFVVDYARCPP